MDGTYRVEVEKETLIFSVAHFITFGNNVCERIHGHNYRVRCHIEGPLNAHGYVADFISVRDRLRELVAQLDHHVILPLEHPTISVNTSEPHEVQVTFEDRRWVFPADDCVLLPIRNTTAELLASYLAGQMAPLVKEWAPGATWLEIGVDENEGQWGVFRMTLA